MRVIFERTKEELVSPRKRRFYSYQKEEVRESLVRSWRYRDFYLCHILSSTEQRRRFCEPRHELGDPVRVGMSESRRAVSIAGDN